AKIEDGLAGDAVAVGAFDGDVVAEIIWAAVEWCAGEGVEGFAGGRGIFEDGAELGEGELNGVVPAGGGLVLGGDAEVGVAIGLEGIVGDAVEVERVRG